ncbi:MAG: hypothetical protein WBB01_00340 [Phormidesmis sp.]
MTASTESNRLNRIEQKLDALSQDLDTLTKDVEKLATGVGTFNDKFDNYQKATQWVVPLAFTLIASATITVIISTVL